MNRKRRLALCLAIALLTQLFCLTPALADTKLDVYIRAFVPETGYVSRGHFDLMIEGYCCYRGVDFEDPVISYNSDSRVHIFNAADTVEAYESIDPALFLSGKIRRWHLRIPYSKVCRFLYSLDGCFSKVSKGKKSLNCTLRSGNPFYRYNTGYTNCFTAVACWMKAMGKGTLYKYAKSHDNITARSVVKRFKGFK